MNIYGSLMDIFDQTKREAQNKTFFSLCITLALPYFASRR